MYFPFMCDIRDKKIAVIGGGRVAYRKCELFLGFGARLTVISPTLCELFSDVQSEIEHICDVFREEYLAGAFAVVAASGDEEVNEAVSSWCVESKVPVNVVDKPELCTFIVPAVHRRGDLTISVCTGGKSPALAAKIRRELEERYGSEYSERLELLGELKKKLRDTEPDQKTRGAALIAACELETGELRKLLKN